MEIGIFHFRRNAERGRGFGKKRCKENFMIMIWSVSYLIMDVDGCRLFLVFAHSHHDEDESDATYDVDIFQLVGENVSLTG